MTSTEILQTLVDAGADTRQAMVGALEDGETLAALGIGDADQEAVEAAHYMVVDSDIDAHLANGGTVGNYQW